MKISPWPMIATFSRVAAVPLIVALMVIRPSGWAWFSFFLFILASITDWLDGYLARKLNSVSKMGKLMDPIADKVLVSSVLIMMIPLGLFNALGVLLLINRDVLIGGVRALAASDGIIIDAGPLGKWKTTVQMIAIPLLFLSQALPRLPLLNDLGFYGLWLTVFLSLVSGFQYFWHYLKAQPA